MHRHLRRRAPSSARVLLLGLPPAVFEAIVPWLILVHLPAGRRPARDHRRGLRRHRRRAATPREPRRRCRRPPTVFATLTGVYGGYFGAGSGVMMVAVLGLGIDLELRIVNALKTLAVLRGQRRRRP